MRNRIPVPTHTSTQFTLASLPDDDIRRLLALLYGDDEPTSTEEAAA